MDKRVTIYDIAEKLGISTATVNRALTGKPRVKEETRALVIKTAAEMGFRPNALARSLARRRMRLAVVGFTGFPEFHRDFLNGARSAGAELKDYNVDVDYFSYDDGAVDTPEAACYINGALQEICDGGYDGALVLAHNSEVFGRLREKGVYVATAVDDLDPSMRSFHVCYNGVVAGRIAAELIYRWMPEHSRPVLIASGWAGIGIHERTVSGFCSQLKQTPLKLCGVLYNGDNPGTAYESTLRTLDEHPDLGAIYVNSFNSSGVIRAVGERNLAGKIVLVTSDINDELRACIRSGVVAASIFQNQYAQGHQGLHLLYRALANGEAVPEFNTVDPQIILSSNLELF